MDVVGHVEVLDGQLLVLKANPVGRRAGRACDANAVTVAKFDTSKETLSEGLPD